MNNRFYYLTQNRPKIFHKFLTVQKYRDISTKLHGITKSKSFTEYITQNQLLKLHDINRKINSITFR